MVVIEELAESLLYHNYIIFSIGNIYLGGVNLQ